jgi:hypothetical protein
MAVLRTGTLQACRVRYSVSHSKAPAEYRPLARGWKLGPILSKKWATEKRGGPFNPPLRSVPPGIAAGLQSADAKARSPKTSGAGSSAWSLSSLAVPTHSRGAHPVRLHGQLDLTCAKACGIRARRPHIAALLPGAAHATVLRERVRHPWHASESLQARDNAAVSGPRG